MPHTPVRLLRCPAWLENLPFAQREPPRFRQGGPSLNARPRTKSQPRGVRSCTPAVPPR